MAVWRGWGRGLRVLAGQSPRPLPNLRLHRADRHGLRGEPPGGAFDEDPGVGPDVVIFERSKAGWCGLETGVHRFEDAGPPEFWRTIFVRLFAGGSARG